MKTLARALILTTKYVDSRTCDDTLDDNVAVLESISHELKKCSVEEKRCLIQVSTELGFESWPNEMGII